MFRRSCLCPWSFLSLGLCWCICLLLLSKFERIGLHRVSPTPHRLQQWKNCSYPSLTGTLERLGPTLSLGSLTELSTGMGRCSAVGSEGLRVGGLLPPPSSAMWCCGLRKDVLPPFAPHFGRQESSLIPSPAGALGWAAGPAPNVGSTGIKLTKKIFSSHPSSWSFLLTYPASPSTHRLKQKSQNLDLH